MSNSLDPDQDRHFVGPDLGLNCLQKLSADDTSRQRVVMTSNDHLVNVNEILEGPLYLTLCMMGNSACCILSANFFRINFFKTFFQQYHQECQTNCI